MLKLTSDAVNFQVENADKKFLIEQMRDSRAVKSSSSVVNESVVSTVSQC